MTTKLPEWASEHDQCIKTGLSCGHQEESLTSAAAFDYDWLQFKGYLGNVDWTSLSYDDLCKFVNDTYRENSDIRIETLADDLGVPFHVV